MQDNSCRWILIHCSLNVSSQARGQKHRNVVGLYQHTGPEAVPGCWDCPDVRISSQRLGRGRNGEAHVSNLSGTWSRPSRGTSPGYIIVHMGLNLARPSYEVFLQEQNALPLRGPCTKQTFSDHLMNIKHSPRYATPEFACTHAHVCVCVCIWETCQDVWINVPCAFAYGVCQR